MTDQANRRWVAVFLLLSMAFMSAVFAVQGALLSAMIDAFDLQASSQGTANAMAFGGGVIALAAAFFVQGRWRKRTLLKAAMVLCAAALVLLWLAPGYASYCGVWFILGFGLGLMDTLLSACMADLYAGDAAKRMMCMLHTAFGLSSVLTPMGYTALMARGTTWKQVYLVIAAGGAALLLIALLVKTVGRVADGEPIRPRPVSLGAVFTEVRESRIFGLVAAMFCHGVFLSGLNTWINRYADTLPGSFSVPAQSCVFAGIMLSRLLMPFLPIRADRYVRLGGLLGCAVLCVGLFVPSGLALRAALALGGLLFGALIPCILTLGCGRKSDNTLLATTAMMLALYIGQGVASPLIAALESAATLRVGIMACPVFAALCSVCCIADARQNATAA